jgi:general secretion pathway protein G
MLLTNIRSTRRKASRRAAFTLLEVLIVVAILVILASAASISLFRYLEDAKVGRAQNDMRVISGAYQKYYMEKQEWPTNIAQVAPYLESGNEGLKDPWGQLYQASVVETQAEDGTTKQRPQIVCQPPGGKPPVYFPAPPKN